MTKLGPTSLPLLTIGQLYHLGEMNVGQRDPSAQSLEGHMLSVSRTPHAWQEIAQLGGRPLMEMVATRAPGKFVDVHGTLADEPTVKALREWGASAGYLREVEQFRAWYLDGETAEWRYLIEPTREAAWAEVDGTMLLGEFNGPEDAPGPDGRPCVEPVLFWAGTTDLERAVNRTSLSNTDATDMALALFVEQHLREIDGLWWNDIYDPAILSAPRGGILPTRLAQWQSQLVEIADVDDDCGWLDTLETVWAPVPPAVASSTSCHEACEQAIALARMPDAPVNTRERRFIDNAARRLPQGLTPPQQAWLFQIGEKLRPGFLVEHGLTNEPSLAQIKETQYEAEFKRLRNAARNARRPRNRASPIDGHFFDM